MIEFGERARRRRARLGELAGWRDRVWLWPARTGEGPLFQGCPPPRLLAGVDQVHRLWWQVGETRRRAIRAHEVRLRRSVLGGRPGSGPDQARVPVGIRSSAFGKPGACMHDRHPTDGGYPGVLTNSCSIGIANFFQISENFEEESPRSLGRCGGGEGQTDERTTEMEDSEMQSGLSSSD